LSPSLSKSQAAIIITSRPTKILFIRLRKRFS